VEALRASLRGRRLSAAFTGWHRDVPVLRSVSIE
jgi:hypothetical protein